MTSSELIAAIANDAATSEDLDELLRTVLERLRDAIRFKGGSLALPGDDGHLRIRTAVGILDDEARAVRIAPGTGIVGTVFTSGRSFRTGDLDAERRVAPAARDVGTNRLSPLTVIRGQAQRLLRRHRGDADEPLLTAIVSQSDRLGRIIAGLIDVARRRAGEPLLLDRRDGDLGAFVAAVAPSLLGPEQKARLVIDAPNIEGCFDRARVEQIVANLVDNATKYAPSGTPIEIRVTPAAGGATITVSDHGRLVAAPVPRRRARRERGPGSRHPHGVAPQLVGRDRGRAPGRAARGAGRVAGRLYSSR